MNSTSFIQQLESLKLLSKPGKALDLGCGKGNDAIALAERGFHVTAVDKNTEDIQRNKGTIDIDVVNSDIKNFTFEKGEYDLAIAKNSLPFISPKDMVYETIRKLSDSLVSGGILYITLFGPKDGWAKEKQNMTFINYDEATAFMNSLDLSPIHRLTEEGLGPLMTGEIKYWHIHRLLYQKK